MDLSRRIDELELMDTRSYPLPVMRRTLKFLEVTRLPIPFFSGIGLLPLPVKLIQVVGQAIPVTRKRGESKSQQINRIHLRVIQVMEELGETAEKLAF